MSLFFHGYLLNKLRSAVMTRIIMRRIGLIIIMIILSSCVTPYQPQGRRSGYSSTQLDTNVFQVTFKGNGFTKSDRANDFALLRSAEITIENGYEHFVIIDVNQYSEDSSWTSPTTYKTKINTHTTYSGNTYGTATTKKIGGQTIHISKPRSSNTIMCFKEKPEGFSYNARFVRKSMKEKYQIQ